LGLTALVALVLLVAGRRLNQVAVAYGLAGGLFFSIGDVATKVATEGGARAAFVVALIVGYTPGTALLRIGYQAGSARRAPGPAGGGAARRPPRSGCRAARSAACACSRSRR